MKAKITIEYDDGTVFSANAKVCYHDLHGSCGSVAANIKITAAGISNMLCSNVEYETEDITDDGDGDNEDKQREDL